MKRSANYNTKQREAILSYIISLDGTHVTAAQILQHFANEEIPISRPTVYRHLEKLTVSGKIRRYTTDGITAACYQHVDSGVDCHEHVHLKCEDCGKLMHLECEKLNEIQNHLSNRHEFRVNALKTVFYGQCANCIQRLDKHMESQQGGRKPI